MPVYYITSAATPADLLPVRQQRVVEIAESCKDSAKHYRSNRIQDTSTLQKVERVTSQLYSTGGDIYSFTYSASQSFCIGAVVTGESIV